MIHLDEIDKRILACLREGGRRSYRDIGEEVSLSAPAVKRRIDELERQGVIRFFTAVVDFAVLGWPLQAFVDVHIAGSMTVAEIHEWAGTFAEVRAAYTVAGPPAAVLHVCTADTVHLEELLERIRAHPGVERTETRVLLSTVLSRATLPPGTLGVAGPYWDAASGSDLMGPGATPADPTDLERKDSPPDSAFGLP